MSRRTTLTSSVAAALALMLSSLPAQVLTGPTGGGGATQTTTTTPGNTTVVNQEPRKQNQPFLGTDAPVFNPGTEIFSWDGQNWNVNNNRLMRARFEKYLNTPEDSAKEDNEYRQVIKEILDALSPHKRTGSNLQNAVALLPRASTYTIDANLCDSLSQAIYGVYLAQRNVAALNSTNAALAKERKKMEWNLDVVADGKLIEKKATNGKGDNAGTSVSEVGRVAGYVQRVAEIEAIKAANKAKMGLSEVQAKLEYQALILQFAVQRRWEHVLMATRIYRRLFDDGDGMIEIKEGSDADKMLAKGLGVSPTVSSLDMFANEVIRDVDEGVRAFEFLVEKDELEGGSKRLAEAFFIGEYLPRIRTLERVKKQKVQRFVQDADALLSAMEVRDYETANDVVDRMRDGAKDFNFSKAKAGIEFYTNMSNTALSQAKIAAQKGEMEEYKRQMQMAIEAWPLNPRIKEQNELFASVADVQVTTLNELDTLLSQGNTREIQRNMGRFLAAVQTDPQRQEQLMSVLGEVRTLETQLATVRGLADRGDRVGAWEIVRQARKDYGDDKELLLLSEELSEDASAFISVLRRAERLEEQRQTGMSLTWYLKAKRMYPNSIFAKDGISRLVEEVLPSDPETRSSGSTPPDNTVSEEPAPLSFD